MICSKIESTYSTIVLLRHAVEESAVYHGGSFSLIVKVEKSEAFRLESVPNSDESTVVAEAIACFRSVSGAAKWHERICAVTPGAAIAAYHSFVSRMSDHFYGAGDLPVERQIEPQFVFEQRLLISQEKYSRNVLLPKEWAAALKSRKDSIEPCP